MGDPGGDSDSDTLAKYKGPSENDDTVSTAQLPAWNEFFADPALRELIESAISGNTSLAVAGIRLRQADESVRASKLAYIPSLFFGPNGDLSIERGGHTGYSYQIPVSVGWNFGSPGSLFARKHQAQARRIQAQDNYDAVLNELISQIAADYYMLQMLDEQIAVLENTITVWTRTLNVHREYMRSGRAYYSSVAQMESKLLDARGELLQARADIVVWEKAICLLAAKPYCSITRSRAGAFPAPELVQSGVGFSQLRSRPDVRAAERDLEITYYLTSEARSAFYPSINLSGALGWPSLVDAALSIVQPIFAQGSLKCRLNVSKMDQEIAQLQFKQTLLQAATEVSQALADYRLHSEQSAIYAEQEEIQRKACSVLDELLRDGKANYLELIKAQEKLLSAQLGRIQSDYKAREAAISLYKALGM